MIGLGAVAANESIIQPGSDVNAAQLNDPSSASTSSTVRDKYRQSTNGENPLCFSTTERIYLRFPTMSIFSHREVVSPRTNSSL